MDYWDGLGWKDPFSRPEWSRRQYGYARAWNSARVYTPQAVINGARECVGSDRSALLSRLRPLRPLGLTARDGALRIEGLRDGLATWTALTVDAARTQVLRGENRGRRLAVPAAVVALQRLSPGAETWSLPPRGGPGRWRAVAFQRDGDWGPVEAAGVLSLETLP